MGMTKPKIIMVGLGWACVAFLATIDTDKYHIEVHSPDSTFVYTPLLAQSIKNRKEITLHGSDIHGDVVFKNDEVVDIDFQTREVRLRGAENSSYDFLVLSHGSATNTFGIPGIEENCYFLKNAEHAETLREKLQALPSNAHIAVIGCGLTGSEVIGTLIDYRKFHIHAIDALPRPIAMFDERLSAYALRVWKECHVRTHMNCSVSSLDATGIHLNNKEKIAYDIAIWCGGIKKSHLTDKILTTLKLENGKGLPVDAYLNVKNTKNVYAMGDCAVSGCPPTAQVAFQQGRYLAHQFNSGLDKKRPFHHENAGQIAYVGAGKGVCQLHYFSGGGRLVYYINKVIHVYNGVTWKQKYNLW